MVVVIPTPKNTSKCKIVQGLGKAKYYPEKNAMLWKSVPTSPHLISCFSKGGKGEGGKHKK